MKMNENQKRIAKNYAIYAVSFMVVFPLANLLFGKGISWENVLIAAVTVLIVGVINLIQIIGSKDTKDK